MSDKKNVPLREPGLLLDIAIQEALDGNDATKCVTEMKMS